MNIDLPERKGELKLNQPKPFTGKREELKKFLQDVKLYLHVNEKIYDTDIKRISFPLNAASRNFVCVFLRLYRSYLAKKSKENGQKPHPISEY